MRPSGRYPARRKPRPGLLASGNLFPKLSRPSGRRPGSAQAEAGLFCQWQFTAPIYAPERAPPGSAQAEAGLFCQWQFTSPIYAPERAPPGSAQAEAGLFFAKARLPLRSHPNKHCPLETVLSHKKMPAAMRAFCFTVCDRRGRTPSTLRRRIHRSYSAAEWWDCCSCAPERDR